MLYRTLFNTWERWRLQRIDEKAVNRRPTTSQLGFVPLSPRDGPSLLSGVETALFTDAIATVNTTENLPTYSKALTGSKFSSDDLFTVEARPDNSTEVTASSMADAPTLNVEPTGLLASPDIDNHAESFQTNNSPIPSSLPGVQLPNPPATAGIVVSPSFVFSSSNVLSTNASSPFTESYLIAKLSVPTNETMPVSDLQASQEIEPKVPPVVETTPELTTPADSVSEPVDNPLPETVEPSSEVPPIDQSTQTWDDEVPPQTWKTQDDLDYHFQDENAEFPPTPEATIPDSNGMLPKVESIGSANSTDRLPDPSVASPASSFVSVVPTVKSGTVTSETELFRITPNGSDHSSQTSGPAEVKYTLTAYDSSGTTSVERSVSVAEAGKPVSVVAGTEIAGRSPEIITVVVSSTSASNQTSSVVATWINPTSYKTPSETSLWEAYRQTRSPEAFQGLVQLHYGMVSRTSQKILGNWADADDISQFVFMVLARWEFRAPTTLSVWLNTVARNASISFLRSKGRRERLEREVAKNLGSDPEESNWLLTDELDHALKQLPGPIREAVELRYLEGYSQKEAAQIVGIPRGTLSQRAASGISQLRQILTEQQLPS